MVCKGFHAPIPGAPLCGKRDFADVTVTNQDLMRKIILDYPRWGSSNSQGRPRRQRGSLAGEVGDSKPEEDLTCCCRLYMKVAMGRRTWAASRGSEPPLTAGREMGTSARSCIG